MKNAENVVITIIIYSTASIAAAIAAVAVATRQQQQQQKHGQQQYCRGRIIGTKYMYNNRYVYISFTFPFRLCTVPSRPHVHQDSCLVSQPASQSASPSTAAPHQYKLFCVVACLLIHLTADVSGLCIRATLHPYFHIPQKTVVFKDVMCPRLSATVIQPKWRDTAKTTVGDKKTDDHRKC